MFFKKKSKEFSDTQIISPVDGEIFPIEDVKDSVFAEQLMGKSMAIQPLQKTLTLVSPANGVLEVFYPTGHAFAVKMKNGIGLLVHIGVDTVELHGKGFQTFAKQGDVVKAGQPIVKVDFDAISKADLETSVMLIITENAQSIPIAFKEHQMIHAMDGIIM